MPSNNATHRQPATLDGSTGLAVAYPRQKRPRHIPLNSLDDVRAELSRLYRHARAGEVATQDATRLGYLLSSLARIIEGAELETRIAALENRLKEKGSK